MAFQLKDQEAGIQYLTHNKLFDADILDVLAMTKGDDYWYHNIAIKLNLSKNYVEFLLHYLAYLGLTDYWTSPRSSWITDKGIEYLKLRRPEIEVEG